VFVRHSLASTTLQRVIAQSAVDISFLLASTGSSYSKAMATPRVNVRIS
jgi:hypothetical protein